MMRYRPVIYPNLAKSVVHTEKPTIVPKTYDPLEGMKPVNQNAPDPNKYLPPTISNDGGLNKDKTGIVTMEGNKIKRSLNLMDFSKAKPTVIEDTTKHPAKTPDLSKKPKTVEDTTKYPAKTVEDTTKYPAKTIDNTEKYKAKTLEEQNKERAEEEKKKKIEQSLWREIIDINKSIVDFVEKRSRML